MLAYCHSRFFAQETPHRIEKRHDGNRLGNIRLAAGGENFFLVVLHGKRGDGDDRDVADDRAVGFKRRVTSSPEISGSWISIKIRSGCSLRVS